MAIETLLGCPLCLLAGLRVLDEYAPSVLSLSYHVSSANLGALPEIAVTHPPDTFCAVYGRAQCITTTRFDGHHPTDKIQRISGPPGGPEIRQQHRRRSQRRIWGQELAPSRPQPPTGGTDGIQPAAGSPTTPGGGAAPPTRVRGWWCWVWCTGGGRKLFRRRNTTGPRCFGPSRGRTEFSSTPFGGL